jgi:hypothetical protein
MPQPRPYQTPQWISDSITNKTTNAAAFSKTDSFTIPAPYVNANSHAVAEANSVTVVQAK